MKVIVAGYPKTGTKSVKAALEILGYNVYDYMENTWILEKEWDKILNEGWTTDDFRRMYENVDAVTDVPACYYWEEIHKAFPAAKIILMIRDEESWFPSFANQMKVNDGNTLGNIMVYLSPSARNNVSRVGRKIGPIALGTDVMSVRNRKLNKQLTLLKYRAHNAYVLQNAPKDKLLVFNYSEGWKPLCDFLGVEIPEVDFPHKNKNGEWLKEVVENDPNVKRIQREILQSLILLTAGFAVGSYYLWTRGPTSLLDSVKNSYANFRNWF